MHLHINFPTESSGSFIVALYSVHLPIALFSILRRQVHLKKMKANMRLLQQLRVSRRAFSTTSRRLDNYAFVGLGQMVSASISIQLTRRHGLIRIQTGLPDGTKSPVEAVGCRFHPTVRPQHGSGGKARRGDEDTTCWGCCCRRVHQCRRCCQRSGMSLAFPLVLHRHYPEALMMRQTLPY